MNLHLSVYAQVQFSLVRSAVVVVTGGSLALRDVVLVVETVVLTRMGMHPRQGS